MAKFAWVGQVNHLDPSKQDNVIEFRASLRDRGFSSHFPLDPVVGFAPDEVLRGPGVVDPKVTKAFEFTDDDYRLRHLRADPHIREV